MSNLKFVTSIETPTIPKSHILYQCGSCEGTFYENPQICVSECPHCFSGNFIEGALEATGEIAIIAEQEICVDCGKKTTDIPRIDYSVEENKENGWDYPEGGYICDDCEEKSYAEAHLEGEAYCPEHGFVASYFNFTDEKGEFIGCYEGCEAAAEYDREVRAKAGETDQSTVGEGSNE